jgi:NAD-dependent deacetylase
VSEILPPQLLSCIRGVTTGEVVALTGAGMSAPSGIPTFRGTSSAGPGLWEQYRAEDLATPAAFEADPSLVWSWYEWRLGLVLSARLNAAHYALARLEQAGMLRMIITQNVDDLHERSGSVRILHLHGSILRAHCQGTTVHRFETSEVLNMVPLMCQICGELLRPDVVWFGEGLNPGILKQAFAEVNCRIFLVIGTSALVMPAGQLPIEPKRHGSVIVEFNTKETEMTQRGLADFTIIGSADKTVPEFVRALLD